MSAYSSSCQFVNITPNSKMNQLIVLCAALAMAHAGGLIGAPAALSYSAAPAVSHVSYASPVVSYGAPAITSQHANIYRSPGNLAQISTYSKSIDTPFSSVSKSDVRVSNPGYAYAAAPALAYAAPAIHHAPALTYASAAPLVTKTIASPAVSYATQTISSSPTLTYAAAAPVVKSYAAAAVAPAISYAAAPAYAYAAAPAIHAAPALSYAAPGPVLAKSYAAPGLLGVAYSAAPAVSHMTYSNGLGLNYGW